MELPQNSILLLQVGDDAALMVVDQPREHHDQHLKRLSHVLASPAGSPSFHHRRTQDTNLRRCSSPGYVGERLGTPRPLLRSPGAVGIPEPLALEERIASLVADSIEPRLLVDIDILPWRRSHLVLLRVHPSPLRPHHMRTEGTELGTYVRLGSTNRRADAALIAELARRPGFSSYDEEPVPDLDSEALDFAAVSESFAGFRTLRKRDLETLGLTTKHQSRRVPTVGGMLLFGRDRLARFPDAWIQAGRFAGIDRSGMADRAELREYPINAIEGAVSIVERNTRLGAEIGRLRRRDVPAVPPVALREALVNAVVHADYTQRGAPIRVAVFDDRVEIENPGILLPGLTPEDLHEGISRLRNPVIGRIFKELGLIEQWGSGIQRMSAANRSAGLPEPEFTELGLRFRVTLRTTATGTPQVDDTERRILEFLDAPNGRSTAELATHIERTRVPHSNGSSGSPNVDSSSPWAPVRAIHADGGTCQLQGCVPTRESQLRDEHAAALEGAS